MPRIHKGSRCLSVAWIVLVASNVYLSGGLLRIQAFGGTNGFGKRNARTTRFRTRTEKRTTTLIPLYSSYDDSSTDGAAAYWRAPNDFSMFLTQRAIQSFMFLTSQLRDPETCYWVEDFTQPNLVKQDIGEDDNNNDEPEASSSGSASNSDVGMSDEASTSSNNDEEERTCHLLRYHGLAAMDTTLFPTWQDYFENMLEQPTDTWVIASDQPHIPDYEWEIDPLSLCSRILSVREQLSKEFVRDLQAVSDMGGQTFDWYWEKLKQSRENNQSQGDEGTSSSSSSSSFVDPSSLRGSRENLLFLEINVDDPTLDHKPSPLRRSNFDLLVLLATEEAIHRVLNQWELKRSEGDLVGAEHASHVFLEQFYQERQHFFHGPLPSYGKADDLLEELLDSALLFKADPGDSTGDSSSVVHPTKIAELVLKERERVALDWMEIAKEAPEHHMRIQALRLEKMMNPTPAASQEIDGANAAETAQNYNGGFDPGPGAFE